MTEETKITFDFENGSQAKTNITQPTFVPLEEYPPSSASTLQKEQQQEEELEEEFLPQDLTSEKEAAIILKTIEQTGGASISVFAITWNLHGKNPPSKLSQEMLPRNKFDLYAISTQECERTVETSVVFPSTKLRWESILKSSLGPEYIMISSISLGAMHLAIFIRKILYHLVNNISSIQIPTGALNVLNNKGGIAICFFLGKTPLLFMNCHFAAHIEHVVARNENFHRICSKLELEGPNGIILKFDDFETVIWLGDMNYRINGDYTTISNLIHNSMLDILIPHDQLLIEKQKGEIFAGFQEGKIKFRPTYKFDVGTNQYDTSEKGRIPAWTDRILYKGKIVQQLEYGSLESVLDSDHKPVYSKFKIDITVDYSKKRRDVRQSLNCCSII